MEPTIQLIISGIIALVTGGLSGFLVFIYKMGKYTEKVDRLEGDRDSQDERIRNLDRKIIACETRLEERKDIGAYLQKRKSPISLSSKGKELLEKSEGKKFIDDDKKNLIKKIKDRNPKSPYDVQELAKEIVSSLKNEEKFTPLKNYAFKEGLSLDVIITVMSVYLRDLAIPEFGYKIEDINNSIKEPEHRP